MLRTPSCCTSGTSRATPRLHPGSCRGCCSRNPERAEQATRGGRQGMARIGIADGNLTVHMEGWDRILALKSTITIPLEHVVDAEADLAEASVVFHGLRLPGTSLPGVITAGSYLKQGEWSFWDVHDPHKAVTIHLRDEHYAKVVV